MTTIFVVAKKGALIAWLLCQYYWLVPHMLIAFQVVYAHAIIV